MAFLASQRLRHGTGPLILAVSLPFLFLHRHYQPSVSIGQVDADLSDVAVAVIVLTALLTADLEPLRRTRAVWAAWGVLAALVVLATAWGAHYSGYPVGTHATTAAKWVEYMLLAPAVVLIAKRASDLVPAGLVLVGWSTVATVVGVLQFAGVLGDLDGTPAGRRKSSLLGYHDFSALSAAVLALSFVVVARGLGPRRLTWVAAASGALGMVVGGAFDALAGEFAATAVIIVAYRVRDPRRLAVILVTLLAVTIGTFGIRSQAVADGLKFLGIKQGTGGAAAHVQSYRQRVLLAYIGGRIFLDHPVLGVGWEGSSDAYAYGPYLSDARARFDQPPEAFPSPQHPWGVQNAYVQALADMGVPGLLAFLAATLIPVAAALRRGTGDGRIAGAALVAVALGVWNGFGLIAGVPLDALTWLGVGVAAASVAQLTGPPHDSITPAR